MVQKIHPRGVIWVLIIRPKFDDSNLAQALWVQSIEFSSPCTTILHMAQQLQLEYLMSLFIE